MSPSKRSALKRANSGRTNMLTDLLTFERLLTGPIVHLIYWCGLCLIILLGFGGIGAWVGLAMRGMSLDGFLVSLPALAGGILVMAALLLLWRSICEFYLAVFRIAEDLHALRKDADAAGTFTSPEAGSNL